jgi:hypothetical protein
MQEFKYFKDQTENGHSQSKNSIVSIRRCSSSSSSSAANPLEDKGRKVDMIASQSYQNTRINLYLHEDHKPGEIRIEPHIQVLRRLTPPSRLILCLGKKRCTREQPVVLAL